MSSSGCHPVFDAPPLRTTERSPGPRHSPIWGVQVDGRSAITPSTAGQAKGLGPVDTRCAYTSLPQPFATCGKYGHSGLGSWRAPYEKRPDVLTGDPEPPTAESESPMFHVKHFAASSGPRVYAHGDSTSMRGFRRHVRSNPDSLAAAHEIV